MLFFVVRVLSCMISFCFCICVFRLKFWVQLFIWFMMFVLFVVMVMFRLLVYLLMCFWNVCLFYLLCRFSLVVMLFSCFFRFMRLVQVVFFYGFLIKKVLVLWGWGRENRIVQRFSNMCVGFFSRFLIIIRNCIVFLLLIRWWLQDMVRYIIGVIMI